MQEIHRRDHKADVLLLEQGKITSGSTWHAAGLVGQLRSSASITKVLKYSVELYKGLAAETALRERRAKGLHPFVTYAGMTLSAAGVALALGGWPGGTVWALLCLHTKLQIHLSDYVQHYGLLRRRLPSLSLLLDLRRRFARLLPR